MRDRKTRAMGMGLCLLTALALSMPRLLASKTQHLQPDEAGVLWIWHHPFPSHAFFAAAASHMMAPPGDFIVGGLIFRAVRALAPRWSHRNLEIAARLYPAAMASFTIIAMGLALATATGSWTIALVATGFMASSSATFMEFAAEVRFYAALCFFSALDWLAFLRFRRELLDGKPIGRAFGALLLVSALGFWFHLYALATAVPMIATALLLCYEHRRWPARSDPYVGIGAAALAASIAVVGAYFLCKANGRSHLFDVGKGGLFDVARLGPLWKTAASQVAPHLSLITVAALVTGILRAVAAEGRGSSWSILVPALAVLAASWGVTYGQAAAAYTWGGRYLIFLLPTAVILLGFTLKGISEVALKRLPRIAQAAVWAGAAGFILVRAPRAERRISDKPDDWIVLRRAIDAGGYRVVGGIGVRPSPDHSLIETERREWLGLSWELYAKGYDGLPSIRDFGPDHEDTDLDLVPCARRAALRPVPMSRPQPGIRDVYIDTCDGTATLAARS